MLPNLSVAVLALFVAASPAQQTAPRPAATAAEQEIIALERQWNDAIKRRDVEAMKQFLADSYFLAVGLEGRPLQTVSREVWLSNLQRYNIQEMSIDDIRVTVHGDTAIALMLYTQRARVGDSQVDRTAQFVLTDVWVKQKDGWRVAERHSSRPESAGPPAGAVPPQQSGPAPLVAELLKDVEEVQAKLVGLARALPDAAWAWRPGAGVRSTGEVFVHVAADNYFIPALLGTAAPAETGITTDYKTVAAFEKKAMAREVTIAELEKSFAFLKDRLKETTGAKLAAPIEVFGQKHTTRGMWVMATSHLHEHLGQLIAYARANKVVPPWSK